MEMMLETNLLVTSAAESVSAVTKKTGTEEAAEGIGAVGEATAVGGVQQTIINISERKQAYSYATV